MVRISMIALAALLSLVPFASAQDDVQQVQQPEAVAPEPRIAVPRAEAPRPAPAPAPATAPGAPARQAEGRPAQAAGASAPITLGDDQRRAEPRGSRPRGDNPPTGAAVPRSTRRVPPSVDRDRDGDRDRGRVYRVNPRPRVYNNYYYRPYYYPRRSYPYGYGAFGLGYFYYDPYGWGPSYYGGYYSAPPRGGYYGYPTGELRLRVDGPKDAHVLVDGYYAGVLDDYDGIVQSLTLEDGSYEIEIVAPGYETLRFDVRIIPGRKITYRGDMRRTP